ncbi:WhiB family transcriptional regulator, redox-sensing transcriptional regulator [Pedococcus dokdonensis]|uniref:Transcriptional regulator WhiB n=1 Tax=Pedococcus dokdonensis TaxID=443156 RepID=A0A1H0UB28_9MICO|nr:WhiB family transcriptional regulator [Pedococcus dokdonensis]SDP63373.1 WhiB family transcriptional regulator, redox-sensing transcriptional regulator [Pedococcus dokdonensis]
MRKPQRLPQPTLDEYEWQDRASCRSVPVAVFFQSENARGGVRAAGEEAAKRVCRVCPVIAQCRVHAIAAEDYGVWGGLTALERAAIRDQPAAAGAGRSLRRGAA